MPTTCRLSLYFATALAVASVLAAVSVSATGSVATAAAEPSLPARDATEGATDTQAAPAGQALRVGIKPLDPFVVRSGSRYSGFSIELWDEIARRNGWSTTYVWYDTLPPLLDDASSSKIDVGIAGISITRERESRMDFSHPMFNAGL